MSDPVKNSEIEDVLSSIRRLVSENHTEPARSEKVTAAAASASPAYEPPVQHEEAQSEKTSDRAASERLVLTPSLRIPEKATEASEPHATSPVADTPFVNSLKEDLQPLRERLPSFLQERREEDADAESSELRDEIAEVEQTIVDEAPYMDVQIDESSDAEEPAENTVLFPVPEELTFESARATESSEEQVDPSDMRPWEIAGERLSEWHSVRSDQSPATAAGFEPDGPEDGDNAGMPVSALTWEDHDSAADEDTADVSAENAEVSIEDAEVVAEPIVEAVVETVIEQATPDDTASMETLSAEQIEAESYETVLDEEMLRELVGEIVRQELQGPLGERITRNVRKLVRREINRALTARSFNDG
ncbi:MAG: hypothetical protein JXQ85_04485 [Cognatishimia sp.]|uniref:hypothetical protein n=1 Tax=Cognatishimia sp. TaxID=2211648 RepID=UPI003B8C4137